MLSFALLIFVFASACLAIAAAALRNSRQQGRLLEAAFTREEVLQHLAEQPDDDEASAP